MPVTWVIARPEVVIEALGPNWPAGSTRTALLRVGEPSPASCYMGYSSKAAYGVIGNIPSFVLSLRNK